MTNFTDGETLTAAALNAAFAAVTPSDSDLLGGTGTIFVPITVGSGLVLSADTLSASAADLVAGDNITITNSNTINVATSPHLHGVVSSAPVGIIGAGATIVPGDHAGNLLMLQTASGPTVLDLVSYANFGGITLERANGTQSAPTALSKNDTIGGFRVGGYDGSGWGGLFFQAGVISQASNDWSPTSKPTSMSFWTCDENATIATPAVQVTHNGIMIAGGASDDSSGAKLQSPSLSIAGLMSGGTLAVGSVAAFHALGAGLAVSSGTLAATSADWNAGTVNAIGNGLVISSNTLAVSAGTGLAFSSGTLNAQWAGGTVVALGTGVSLVGGTISATGSGGSVTSVVTSASPYLTAGTISTTGTITAASAAASTLIGNATTASAVPTAVPIGSGLAFSSGTLTATGSGGSVTSVVAGTGLAGGTITTTGTLSLATRTASTLMGNAGTVAATPGDVAIGSGLSLSTAGTLTATGSGGSVTKVSTSGLVTGGDITTTGTISLASQAATTLVGNGTTASAVPTAIPIGSGLTFSSGTLTATGSGGSVTSVISGAGLHAGTITTTGTLLADWNGGTVAALGTGLAISSSTLSPQWQAGSVTALGGAMAINSGTIAAQNQGTVTLSGTTTGTINPAGIDSCIVNIGTANGTIAVSPGFQGQRLRAEIKQGATAHTATFTSTVSFGTTVTSYTATNTASARDLCQLFCVDGTHWAFAAVSQGFTI